MQEIFKDIEGYEGLYQISNFGNVKSLGNGKSNNYNLCKERILKHDIMHGHPRISLSKNGKSKHFFVHRLVAFAFIPNPNNYPIINHKDEIKTNNNVDNLEWCDCKYNSNYGTVRERLSNVMKGKKMSKEAIEKMVNAKSKPILQLTKNGEIICKWKSGAEIKRVLGFHPAAISKVCLGKQKTSYGYKWKFAC